MIRVYDTNIFDMLELIKRRSQILLPEKSIQCLESFIDGYMVFGKWGLDDEVKIYKEGDPDLNEFKYWLHNIPYVILTPGPRFSALLLERTNNDKEKAFDLFFELLEEFKTLKKR